LIVNVILQQYRDSELATDGKVVGFYEREFYVFSNFSSFQVQWKGRLWPTSEHAYQAAHYFETSPELVEQIFNAKSAHEAFKIAKSHPTEKVANWQDIKISVMEDICRHKLQQHPYIQEKLRQTMDVPMAEDSPVDAFWGWGPNRDGRNELGKVWMRLREELKSQ
jgi:ribA/ribD-fused uncharacterized protein